MTSTASAPPTPIHRPPRPPTDRHTEKLVTKIHGDRQTDGMTDRQMDKDRDKHQYTEHPDHLLRQRDTETDRQT